MNFQVISGLMQTLSKSNLRTKTSFRSKVFNDNNSIALYQKSLVSSEFIFLVAIHQD